jgi:hypothetical protein
MLSDTLGALTSLFIFLFTRPDKKQISSEKG